MEFFNNNNSLERVGNLSFTDWALQHKQSIEACLIDEGVAFLNEQGEDLRTPVTNLLLDDRWHYIDKPSKKQSYRAKLEYHNDGVPYLNLTYYTFKHGGQSVRFESKDVLKRLWVEERSMRFQKKPSKPVALVSHIIPKPLEEKPVDWVASDKDSWQSMSLSGISHYLKRKGLSDDIPGIRYAKHHIAIAIINTQNEFLGLQRIFNDGQKRFSKGLSKKGHFAVIGETSLPIKPTTIHVCEGLATAASIHLATGEVVFCALDAFNLLPVCYNLKRHYAKTSIIIWADNDWQKADKVTKFGRVIGNTGLIQANRAAFKLRNALVCTPDFSSLSPDLIIDATDFNDLHKLCGVASLLKTTPKKPELGLALWHELHRYTKYAHGVLTAQQFSAGVKHTYNARYLPRDVFLREGVHLVRSPIGTGKTAIVEHLVKNNPKASILFTTHLISLVESAAQRLGLVSYNACDAFDLQIESRLAICLNSLGKLTSEGALKSYDVVIIDEIEQVLARLTSPIEQKPLVFNVLAHLIAHAKTLICLDAHLSQTTVQLIKRFCPNAPVTVHFNEFAPGLSREILFHEHPESVQMAALQSLEDGKKVYLAFNSKKEAYKTFNAFSMALPEKKGLYISGDNTGDAENQAFFSDVNEMSARYDYVICTPSVSTGVSIDNGHFDFVGGVFNAQVNTANDCMQALGRVRNHKTLHVFCDRRLAFKSLNPDVIASKWGKTHQHDLSLMNLDALTGTRILLNPDYEDLALSVTQNRHRSFNNFYEQFALLALHDGMHLSYFDSCMDVSVQKQLRQFKNACVEHATAQLCAAELPLTASQLLALAKKPLKTMADTFAFKKQQVTSFFNLSEKDNQSIHALAAIDNDGRFKKQLLSLELALGDAGLAKKRFLEQVEEGTQFAADLTHFSVLQMLYQKLLEVLHATTPHGLLAVGDFQYSKDTLVQSGFLDFIEAHRAVFQGVVTLPSAYFLQKDPLRFVSMLLARLGLKQKRVGRAERGLYHLDIARVQLLNALVMRRRKGIAGVGMPLDVSSCAPKKASSLEFFGDVFRKIKGFFTEPLGAPVLV
jgi:hypothetical protein